MSRGSLEQDQAEILARMGRIRTMRRGTVSEPFLKVSHQGQAEPVMRGPYFLWQYWENGKPVRKRLRTAAFGQAAGALGELISGEGCAREQVLE